MRHGARGGCSLYPRHPCARQVGGLVSVVLGTRVVRRGQVHGEPVAAGAQQPVDRQPGGLTRDIPQGDVDDAQRDRADEVAQARQATPMASDVQRISSQQQRLHEGDDLPRDGLRAGTRIAQEVRALDSRVGPDPENPHGKLPIPGSEHRQRRRRALVHRDRDIGDLQARRTYQLVCARPERLRRRVSTGRGASPRR